MSIWFPFQGAKTETDLLNEQVIEDAKRYITDLEFLAYEINKFKQSEKRQWMIDGDLYYRGDQLILNTPRTVIGAGGKPMIAHNLADNRIVDNQYAKLVDQKANYQLGRVFSVESEDDRYQKILTDMFSRKFGRTLKNIMTSSLNAGIGWMYIYYDRRGELSFKQFPSHEILPFYDDEGELDYFIRIYAVLEYEGQNEVAKEKVEVYSRKGVEYYTWNVNSLIPDAELENRPYMTVEREREDGERERIGFNWDRVPLIPFRFNAMEIPLIKRVKSLQDGINTMISTFQNNMMEDSRNTLLVLYNYDGQDLGEFRKNIAEYGVIKIRNTQEGDIKALTIEVNAANYEVILKIFKNALIENGRGFDAKDDRMSSNPNQMNIQSMYSDIELDANGIETEYQAAFEDVMWFIDKHLANTGQGNFDNSHAEIIFNRDMLANESEIIKGLVESGLITLSQETLIAQHPYVKDPQLELERIANETARQLAQTNPYRDTLME